jgi:hypothetical protein
LNARTSQYPHGHEPRRYPTATIAANSTGPG